MLTNKTIAALLKKGVEADIWYDAATFNEDGSEDQAVITIEITQEAMMQAALILEQLPTN